MKKRLVRSAGAAIGFALHMLDGAQLIIPFALLFALVVRSL